MLCSRFICNLVMLGLTVLIGLMGMGRLMFGEGFRSSIVTCAPVMLLRVICWFRINIVLLFLPIRKFKGIIMSNQ